MRSPSEFREPLAIIGLGDVVNGAVQLERLFRRKIPHQLLAVAEHQGDAPLERGTAAPGDEAGHGDPAARGVQQAREHLERRGLARAVRSEEPDDLPRLDAEGHVAHRVDVAVAGLEERLERAFEPGVPHFDLEGLAEPIGRDGGRHTSRM